MNISLSAFVPENLVSRDGFGSPVPRQPAHLHTQAESAVLTYGIPPDATASIFILKNRQTPSGQARVYRVTQSRTDGVHCRESAGTELLVNLKVVPNECLGRSPWTNEYTPLFPTHTNGIKWACWKYRRRYVIICTINCPQARGKFDVLQHSLFTHLLILAFAFETRCSVQVLHEMELTVI